MMRRWNDLENRTLRLSRKIPAEQRDAFYQLVEYPAVASAGVAKIYLSATLGDTLTMQALFERDRMLSERYNKDIAYGKWNGMMQDNHIGYTKWSMPEKNTLEPALSQMKEIPERDTVSAREIAIMAHDYSRRTTSDDASWRFLPGLGRGKGCMGIEPVTAGSRPDGDGATMEYDFTTASDCPEAKAALGILPTNDVNPGRGLRIGIRIDNGEIMTVDARQGYVDTFGEYNKENLKRSQVLKPLPRPAKDIYLSGYGERMRNEIFDNLRWLSIPLGHLPAGKHTLMVVMIDPEIVVEKIIINPDNEHPSYYGSPTF